jgi:hypothetical protein
MAPNPHHHIRKRGLRAFEKRVASQLPALLDRLLDSPKHPRAEHKSIPKAPGVYLFLDAKGKPIYVGQSRNIRGRLAQHCRASSPENAASFAFNIAKRNAEGLSVDISGFRKELSKRTDFEELFLASKAQVALMPVQFTVEEGADRRTVFEVFAAYALGTQEYNTFETH